MRNAVLRLRTRLTHAMTRSRDETIVWTVIQVSKRLLDLILWLLLLPLALALHLVGVRRIPVITQRIGHLAAEVDCFLKERALQRLPARRWFIAAPPRKTANHHLLNYWRPHVRVIDHPVCADLLWKACRPPIGAYDIAEYVLTQHSAARYAAVNTEWGTRRALLTLTNEDRAWGVSMLTELGIPRDAWFVCVHPRTPGFAPHDDSVHAYRNSTPAHLAPAIAAIARRGGWCVLMGDPSAPKLPALPNLLDYAHHRLRSQRLDVVLCAMCHFFLGSSSGLFVVSTVFGVPSALANLVPMGARPYASGDLYIPKLYRSLSDSRLLSFSEVLASPSANFRHGGLLRDAGIELIENSPDEIVDLVEEMLDSLEGRARRAEEHDNRFERLFKPHHYGYGSGARISYRFLARHRDLLPH